jgi:hypothetical protein
MNLPAPQPRRDIPSLSKKKDSYHYRDEAGAFVGPFELSTLHLWWSYGLISESLLIHEGQSQAAAPLGEVLRAKGLYQQPVDDRNEWFLWTDPKNPFHTLTNRLNKGFQSRHQKNDFKLLSIVSQSHQINHFPEFEDFIEQCPAISDEIKELHLNHFAEPFAMWTFKTLTDLKCQVSPQDVKALLLETDPERAKGFFLHHLRLEREALRVYGIYNQWRLFIPVFAVNDTQ